MDIQITTNRIQVVTLTDQEADLLKCLIQNSPSPSEDPAIHAFREQLFNSLKWSNQP